MKAYTEQSERQRAQTIEQVQRQRRMQREEDIKSLMRQPWGRRLAYWLIYDVCGVREEVFDLGLKYHPELDAAKKDGRRVVGIEIDNEFQRLAPDLILEMVAEQIQATKADLALETPEQSE